MKKKILPAMFAALILASAAASIWWSWRSGVSRTLLQGKPISGLIIGTDFVDNARHSDTIIYARYNPTDRKLDFLSIPRDTRVELPKLRVRRINEVYAYYYKASKKNHHVACQELCKAVQWLLFSSSETRGISGSTQALPSAAPSLDYYAQIDYDGFKKIIDLLGGIDVTVDEPMNYDDNWGKLHIHFSTGAYHLNGQKALEYIRFRGQSGDYGRLSRQQEFMPKVIQRFTNPLNIVKLPEMIAVSMKSVQTNLSWYERLLALWELKDLAREQTRLIQLPGRAQRGFWIPDAEGVRATAALLIGERETGTEFGETRLIGGQVGGQALVSPAADKNLGDHAPADFSKVTLEVWNASSNRGLALKVMRELREAGFDVVKWGNYEARQKKTLVFDHRGDARANRGIVEALKSPQIKVITRMETSPLVDVEVILGEDYEAGNR